MTRVIIETLSISKNDTYSTVLPGWALLEESIFCIALAAGSIFSNIHPAEMGVFYLYWYWQNIIVEYNVDYIQVSNTCGSRPLWTLAVLPILTMVHIYCSVDTNIFNLQSIQEETNKLH